MFSLPDIVIYATSKGVEPSRRETSGLRREPNVGLWLGSLLCICGICEIEYTYIPKRDMQIVRRRN